MGGRIPSIPLDAGIYMELRAKYGTGWLQHLARKAPSRAAKDEINRYMATPDASNVGDDMEGGEGDRGQCDEDPNIAVRHLPVRYAGGGHRSDRSARSLIPRSIFWLITKLSTSVGSTMSRAQGRVYAYRSRTSRRVFLLGSSRSTKAQVES